MFTDTYQLIDLGIAEAHRQADLERSFRRNGRVDATAAARSAEPRHAIQAAVAVPPVISPSTATPDAALMAAGERSDALLTPACGPCQTADQAA